MTQEFILELIKGDKPAQQKFFVQYYPQIFKLVSKKIGDSRDGEEITQNVITNAIYCLPSYSGKNPFSSWLFAIARHEIADFYRKKKLKEIIFSLVPGLEKIATKALSPETAMQEIEIKQKIIFCLASLSEGYAHILRLKYIDGLTLAQIAKKINAVSVKSVEMRLRRARLSFIYNWQNGSKKTAKTFFDLSSRDISILAKHFGIAYSPVPHPAKNLERT